MSQHAIPAVVRICGVDFRLESGAGCNPGRLLGLCDGLFCALPVAPSVAPVTIHIEDGIEHHPAHSAPPGAERLVDSKDITVDRLQDALWLTTTGMACTLRPDRAEVAIDDSFWQKSLFDQRDFLLMLMVSMLRMNKVYAFHGNGLANAGAGIVITGDSGAGKTTLTGLLIRNGWNYLADDAIALHSDRGRVTAWALRNGFSLTSESYRRSTSASLWDESSVRALGNGKFLAWASASVRKQFVASCVPGAIFFSEIADTGSTVIEPISEPAALMSAMRQAALLTMDSQTAGSHLNILRDLVQQSASYRIICGRDALDDESAGSEVADMILQAARIDKRST